MNHMKYKYLDTTVDVNALRISVIFYKVKYSCNGALNLKKHNR